MMCHTLPQSPASSSSLYHTSAPLLVLGLSCLHSVRFPLHSSSHRLRDSTTCSQTRSISPCSPSTSSPVRTTPANSSSSSTALSLRFFRSYCPRSVMPISTFSASFLFLELTSLAACVHQMVALVHLSLSPGDGLARRLQGTP